MRRALVSLLLCSLAACAYDEVDTSTTGQALEGEGLNGDQLNGKNLNGSGLGNSLQWVSYSPVLLHDWRVLLDVWIDGSELIGTRKGQIVRGTDFAGAELLGMSDAHRPVWLRIADVVPPDPKANFDDVWHYMVEFRYGNNWIPLCLANALTGDGLNGPLLNGDSLNQALANGDVIALGAIPLDGYWDYRSGVDGGGDKIETGWSFTFACPVIGAIGKCVEAGYRPWATGVDGSSLEGEHEACVRLMRADYCGDGTPHTVDGTLVNIYDEVGVQDDAEPWPAEAEWDAGGARCVTEHLRHATPIACYDQLYDPGCGTDASWTDGTLLVSETP